MSARYGVQAVALERPSPGAAPRTPWSLLGPRYARAVCCSGRGGWSSLRSAVVLCPPLRCGLGRLGPSPPSAAGSRRVFASVSGVGGRGPRPLRPPPLPAHGRVRRLPPPCVPPPSPIPSLVVPVLPLPMRCGPHSPTAPQRPDRPSAVGCLVMLGILVVLAWAAVLLGGCRASFTATGDTTGYVGYPPPDEFPPLPTTRAAR